MTGRQLAHLTEASLGAVVIAILGGITIAVREARHAYRHAPRGGAQ